MYNLYVEFTAPIDDYCEALSFSIGMRSTPAAGGVNRKAQANDASFSATSSSLSNKLLAHFMKDTKFAKVWIEFYRTSDDSLYLYYELLDVRIMSIRVNQGVDHVGLNYGTMTYKYFQK